MEGGEHGLYYIPSTSVHGNVMKYRKEVSQHLTFRLVTRTNFDLFMRSNKYYIYQALNGYMPRCIRYWLRHFIFGSSSEYKYQIKVATATTICMGVQKLVSLYYTKLNYLQMSSRPTQPRTLGKAV